MSTTTTETAVDTAQVFRADVGLFWEAARSRVSHLDWGVEIPTWDDVPEQDQLQFSGMIGSASAVAISSALRLSVPEDQLEALLGTMIDGLVAP